MWAAICAMKTPYRVLLAGMFFVAFPLLAWMLAAWGEASHGFGFVSVFVDVIFVELILGGLVLHGIVEEYEQYGDDLGASSRG